MKLPSEQPEQLSRRAHCEDELKKNNGTMNSSRPSKGNRDNLFLGVNSDHVPAAFCDRAGVRLEEDQAEIRLGQQDGVTDPPKTREVSMLPDRFVTQVRSDTLKRMYVTRSLGKKYGPTPGCPGCATIGSHRRASHSDTRRDRMRALEKSEGGREFLARQQARVDARTQEQSSSSSHKRAVSGEWDRPPKNFVANGRRGCDNETGCHRHKWCFILQCKQRTSHGHRK